MNIFQPRAGISILRMRKSVASAKCIDLITPPAYLTPPPQKKQKAKNKNKIKNRRSKKNIFPVKP